MRSKQTDGVSPAGGRTMLFSNVGVDMDDRTHGGGTRGWRRQW